MTPCRGVISLGDAEHSQDVESIPFRSAVIRLASEGQRVRGKNQRMV